MASKIRIWLADDHPVVVNGVRAFLELDGGFEVCGVSHDANGLAEKVRDAAVDLLLLDLRMPGMQGGVTVQSLADVGVRVVLFTFEPLNQATLATVAAGAAGYAPKSTHLPDLVRMLKRVAAGETVLPDAVSAGMATLGTQSPPHLSLSARERAVFEAFLEGHPPKWVAAELSLSTSTVYTYLERIRAKIGVDSLPDLMSYAVQHGLNKQD